MFIAELFTIPKTWKQARCPLTEDPVEGMWRIRTVENCSAKIKRSAAICNNTEGAQGCAKLEGKDKDCMSSFRCWVETKSNTGKTNYTYRQQRLPGGRVGETKRVMGSGIRWWKETTRGVGSPQ